MTSGIVEILIENTNVQDLVGRNVANTKWKVYPTVVPEKENAPFIVVTKMTTAPTLVKDSQSLLDYPQYQVVCYSKVFHDTELMAEAVRLALDNQGFTTDVGAAFERVWLTDDRDGFDLLADLYAHISIYSAELKRAEPT